MKSGKKIKPKVSARELKSLLSLVRFTRHVPVARPPGRAGTRCKNAPGIFVRVRAPSLKNPPLAGFCVCSANPVHLTPYLPEQSEFGL